MKTGRAQRATCAATQLVGLDSFLALFVRPPFSKDSAADWTSPDPINVVCWQPKTLGQVSQLLGIGVIRFSGLRRDL